MRGMGERWLTRLGGAPRLGLAAGAALALAAFGQAVGQAVTLGFANASVGQDPGLLAFLYAVPLCALALLSTVPLLFARPAAAAVVAVLANVLVLAVFPGPDRRRGAGGGVRRLAAGSGRLPSRYRAGRVAAPGRRIRQYQERPGRRGR